MKTDARGVMTRLCILLAVGAILLPVSLFATTTIGDYVVYGENGVKIGGGSTVIGLVGARNPYAGAPINAGIYLNGLASSIGDARCGTNVDLANSASITGTLFVNNGAQISLGSGSSIGATNYGNPDLPVFPSATSFVAGTSNIVNLTAPLTVGSYSNITLGSGDTLTLTSGVYYLNSITLSGTATVNLNTTGGQIKVYMTGDANLDGRDANVIGSNGIYWEVHGDWTQGGGTSWAGTLFVPFGTANIGSGSGVTDFTGQIWANTVNIEHGVTVMIPEPSTITLGLIGLAGLAGIIWRPRRLAG